MAAQITSIPTLMAFRDGVAVFRQSGALPLSALEDLISQIQGLDMDDVRRKIAESDQSGSSPQRAPRQCASGPAATPRSPAVCAGEFRLVSPHRRAT